MLKKEKLKGSELQLQLDRARLTSEIESPSYKLAKLRFQMDQDQLLLQERACRMEKELLKCK
jgi:hypothetical protein